MSSKRYYIWGTFLRKRSNNAAAFGAVVMVKISKQNVGRDADSLTAIKICISQVLMIAKSHWAQVELMWLPGHQVMKMPTNMR